MLDKPRRRKSPYVMAVGASLLIVLLVVLSRDSTSSPEANPEIGTKVAALEDVMVQLKAQLEQREKQAADLVSGLKKVALIVPAGLKVKRIENADGDPQTVLVPGAGEAAASTMDHMKYWLHGTDASPIKGQHDRLPADRSWIPPTRPGKYLVLSSDSGGFNNIRLAFETGIVFAVLTGRTLVLPAKKKWYLLGAAEIGFEDFFCIEDLKKLVPTIYYHEYQQLHTTGSSKPVEGNVLQSVIVFPNIAAVELSHKDRKQELRFHRADNGNRKYVELTPGTMLHDTDILTVNNARNRLLATWHTFFVFADEAHDLALKRLMRDCVHYTDAILEPAVRGIDELGGWGTYTSMHVRRGDFQYHEVKIGADKLFKNVEPLLKRSGKERLYIMTDETDTPFFKHFLESGYKISFFKNLKSVGEIPYHHIGMVEQMISAGGNLFVGTRLSTFSSYTIRTRGYQVGARNKEVFYADREYTGDEHRDGNEKNMDTSNTMLGGGEMGYFREPKNVWVEDDWRR